MDNYTLPHAERLVLVRTQINECQTLIYRNNLENIVFKSKKDEDKMTEVEVNNNILKRKIDGLVEELGRLNEETKSQNSSNTSV